MKTLIDRRQLLSGAAQIGAGLSLSSCTALDRLLMGQSSDLSERVVILGGGLAGLRAAYELRKKSIPYRLFEGSSRVGGRAWTLQSLTPASQSGDIGFEWFSRDQSVFWQLAQELKLEIVEVPGQKTKLFMIGGSGYESLPEADLKKIRDMARAQERLPSDLHKLQQEKLRWRENFDAQKMQSVFEWAQKYSKSSVWTNLVQAWCANNFGVSSSQLPAWTFAQSFLFSNSVLEPWNSNRFKFRAGSSSLAEAMLDRVLGVIPGDRLLVNHRLIQVEKLARGGYELHFETLEGRRRFRASQVICTLPWGVLQKVEGLEDIIRSEVLTAAKMSSQTKAVLSFRERFWRKNWDQGHLLGRPEVWESTFRSQEWLENSWGLLSLTWSFDKPGLGGTHLIKSWLSEIQKFEKRSDLPLVETHLQDWSTSKWSLGSRSVPRLDKLENDFQTQQLPDWLWAGEHVAGDLIGTAAGALQSGAQAAARIESRLQKASK